MTGPRTGPRQLRNVSLIHQQPHSPAQTHSQAASQRPLPFLYGLGLTYLDGPKHRDNSKPTRSGQEMRESGSTGEPSQEVQTKQRPVPRHRPPRLLQAHPAPFRPADPVAPELLAQFLFCQAGLRNIFPMHLPLGSVLTFPEGRVVEGAGSAPGSDPPGPVVNPLRPYPTRWTAPSRAFPRAAVSPVCCIPRGKVPLLPSGSPGPPPPWALLRLRGRVAEREEALEEGGSGSGPTCISVPAVSSGGGGGSRSLRPPLPAPRRAPSPVLRRRRDPFSRRRRKRP